MTTPRAHPWRQPSPSNTDRAAQRAAEERRRARPDRPTRHQRERANQRNSFR